MMSCRREPQAIGRSCHKRVLALGEGACRRGSWLHLMLVALYAIAVPAAYVPRPTTAGCIRWQSASASFRGDAFAAVPTRGALCRRSVDGMGTETDSFKNIEHGVLPVGVYDAATRQCNIPGAPAPAAKVELAVVEPTRCDVWWRYVSDDAAKPLPALTLQFGSSGLGGSEDILYGICRTRGEDPQLGTLIFHGPEVGDCVVPADGQHRPELRVRGGDYDTIEARPLSGCRDDPQQREMLKSSLKSKLDEFLTPADHVLIAEVSGHSYKSLETEVLALGSCDLSKVLSTARFMLHDLNWRGLTVLRHLLAERMYDARINQSGARAHPDFEQFRLDGFLRKDLDAMTDEDVIELLRMVSGEQSLGIPEAVAWERRPTMHAENDPQYEKHIDAGVGPTFKLWVYPANTTIAEGPLHYSPGSHRNTLGKLRWMHESMLPPATEALREPALRMRVDETDYGLAPVVPMLPLAGVARTLIVADTSGIHYRGLAMPGTQRYTFRLVGDNDGGLPRLDPFRSVTCTDQCSAS